MKLMHHDVLRVNAEAPASAEVFAIYAERGWVEGEHPDTDLDDPAELRRVKPPAKAKAKATSQAKE